MPDRRSSRGALAACVALSWLAALGLTPHDARAQSPPKLFTLAEPVPFEGLGMAGTLEPVGAEEQAAFDFSGSGLRVGAMPGDHVCQDGVGFFGACSSPSNEIFLYRVTLDAQSARLSGAVPTLDPDDAADLWSGYIFDGDVGTHDPDAEYFSRGSRGVVFLDANDDLDESRYLQPGETTAPLITSFFDGTLADPEPGQVLSIAVHQGLAQGFQSFLVPVTVVPEPGGAAALWAAGLGLGWTGVRRSRPRRGA